MNPEIQKRIDEYFQKKFSVEPSDFEVPTTATNKLRQRILKKRKSKTRRKPKKYSKICIGFSKNNH